MSDGLQQTIDLLATTRNESATRILIAALDSSSPFVREAALPALIARRSPAGEREVLRRLHELGPAVYASLDRHHCSLSRALRGAVVGNDNQTFINACHEIIRTREYDLLPTLLAALEDASHPNPDLATSTMLALVDSLCELLKLEHPPLQNPAHVRKRAVDALQESLNRYPRHQRREVVEAFCRIADRDHPQLLELLGNPHHPAYLVVCEVFARSQHPAIRESLIGYLSEPHPPSAALTILARRVDAAFVEQMLKYVADQSGNDTLTRNLKHIEIISWATGDSHVVDALPDELQEAAVRMAMTSRMNRQKLYGFVAHILQQGGVEARRAAARALAEFAGVQANGLAMRTLHDVDPEVQSHIVGQLRSRAIPGAIQQLLEKLDSPYPSVRRAARESLSEFRIDRYLAAFDGMEPDVRRSTGDLVKRVDPDTLPRLRSELQSPVRGRRLRALAAAETLSVVTTIDDAIIELLADDDGFVRSEAVRCLAQSNSPACRRALEYAAADKVTRVREAAQRALAEINTRAERPPSTDTIPLTTGETQLRGALQ